ncbi:leucine-rich melanocyte differentiation-associated protein-like isoform X2 [Oppia nitens]|nr:leucine-rich melanocyte differentiation-associated protein-like isoform X2 [Oppia nitens]
MYLSGNLCNNLNESNCLVWSNNQLSYIGQDVKQIPSLISKIYGPNAVKLDLSFNIIDTIDGIEDFTCLRELILDNNLLNDNIKFSFNPLLHTLSLNKNKITDLESLLNELSNKCPNLTFLSLLGNNACPDQLSNLDKDEEDYARYRRYVIYRLPYLKFLDSSKVSNIERKDANERGKYLKTIRPIIDEFDDNCERRVVRQIFTPLPTEDNSSGSHSG